MTSTEPDDNCDSLILWAVRESDQRRFVHVGMLTAKENGAACRCLCRSCGERLIAINTDKPPKHFELPRTKRRHFQHRGTVTDQARCARKIAQMVALQVFVEQDTVYLPRRERSAKRKLPNGGSLLADLSTAPEKVRVLSRTWIDDFEFNMVLEGGREMRVTVRARHTLDANANSTCVLSLAGACDPMMASWDNEKILEHLRAPQNGLQWAQHWDDVDRAAMAEGELNQQQSLLLGDIPPEWLEGLNGKQFSETILHYLIKRAVVERGSIRVPEYRVLISHEMPDGKVEKDVAYLPACVLLIEDVRLEKRLGNMVPDVLCRATAQGASGLSFDLMIEGAVTHKVDTEKFRKVVVSNVACIEIQAGLFDRVGQVPAAVIEEIVCSSEAVKQWIYLPHAHEAAKRRLGQRAAAIQRKLQEEKRQRESAERARVKKDREEAAENEKVSAWAARCSDAKLVEGYVRILKTVWAGDSPYSKGHKVQQHKAVIEELRKRKISTESSVYVESGAGVFRSLVAATEEPWEAVGWEALRTMERAARGGEHANYAVDLMFALATRVKDMSPEQQQLYKDFCALVRKGIAEESSKFRRDERRMKLHALIVPALGNADVAFLGTPKHYAEMKSARERAERKAHLRKKRKALVAIGRAKQEKAAKERAIQDAIELVSNGLRWRTFPFGDPPSSVVLLTRYNQNPPKDLKFVELSVQDLIQKAESFRRDSAPIKLALMALNFQVVDDVHMAARALVYANLCASR